VHPRLVLGLFLLVTAASAAAGLAASVAADPCWNATIRGTAGNDVLRGTPHRDVIAGGFGNDVLIGGAGDDLLCGGPGSDKLRGQTGDDVLLGGADERVIVDTEAYEWHGDALSGGPGDDVLDGGSDKSRQGLGTTDRITYVGSATGVTVDLLKGRASGEGEDTIRGPIHDVTGSRYDDVFRGTNDADHFDGSAGSDWADGRGGADWLGDSASTLPNGPHTPHDELGSKNVLIGGAGNDEIFGGAGDDDIRGGTGDDNLGGDYGVDRISGGTGDDQVGDWFGAQPGARIDGGPGTDTLADVMFYVPSDIPEKGGRSDSAGTVDLAGETITSSVDGVSVRIPLGGIENASSGWGTWTMIGTDGPNELIAGDEKHPVRIIAGGGDDQMMGSFKHDLLDGGAGKDTDLWSPGKDERISIEKIRR